MAYNRNRNYRRTSGAGSRWMNLRYAGNCKVCGSRIAAGDFAYWDAGARTVLRMLRLTTREMEKAPMSNITKLIATVITGLLITTLAVVAAMVIVSAGHAHASTQAASFAVASHVERGGNHGHGKH